MFGQLEFNFDAPTPGGRDEVAARRERWRAAKHKQAANPQASARKRERDRQRYAAERARLCAEKKRYRDANIDLARQREREQRAKARAVNPEKLREYQASYYAENRERKIAAGRVRRPEINARDRHRRAVDPVFALRKNLRVVITRAIKRIGGRKSARSFELVGCTNAFLRAHLESQFLPGMSWQNYGDGPGKWNVDHRIALGSVGNELLKPEIQRLLNHWTNLQPMWSLENNRKRKRIIQEHQFPLLIDGVPVLKNKNVSPCQPKKGKASSKDKL